MRTNSLNFLFQYSGSALSSLTTAWVRINLALYANFTVVNVSLTALEWGFKVQIMTVFAFPPRLSFKRWVNLLSLKLMYVFAFESVLQHSDRSKITLPSTERLVLILHSSYSRWPSAWVSLTRSLPARSTMWNLDDLTTFSPVLCYTIVLMKAVKTAWDRDDSMFILVEAICRFS